MQELSIAMSMEYVHKAGGTKENDGDVMLWFMPCETQVAAGAAFMAEVKGNLRETRIFFGLDIHAKAEIVTRHRKPGPVEIAFSNLAFQQLAG